MYIYPWQMDTPGQLSINALNTATPNVLVFCRKDLCEARVKPKMSSNLADEPSLADVLSPFETVIYSRSLIG